MRKILLLDIACPSDIQDEFSDFGLEVFTAEEMTKELLAWPRWRDFNPASTIIVFPGNGANLVRKHFSQEWLATWPRIFLPYAKRVWYPGENPRAYAERIFPQGFLLGVRNVVVIDDVISSGITMRKIWRENVPFIPGANWAAVCWVAQQAATLKNFSLQFATRTVGEKNKKIPINSLSTLLQDPDIAVSYAYRNLGERAKEFLALLRNVR